MKLSKKQREFTLAIGKLILFAYNKGYELTFGDAYRDPRVHGQIGETKSYSHKNSVHKVRLAVDFNLFVNDKWVADSSNEAFQILHDHWILLGGAEQISTDMNHFSYEHNGTR